MAAQQQAYRIPGGPTGTLLIPGTSETATELHNIANDLARAGHTVLCPQLAGLSSPETRLAACKAGLDELHAHCDTVIVCSLKNGAALALSLAANYAAKVDALALLVPQLSPVTFQHNWLAGLVQALKGTRLCRDLTRSVSSIAHPVLIVQPRNGCGKTIAHGAYLQHQLAGTVDVLVVDDGELASRNQHDMILDRTSAFMGRIASKPKNRAQTVAVPQAPAPVALAPVALAKTALAWAPSLQAVAA